MACGMDNSRRRDLEILEGPTKEELQRALFEGESAKFTVRPCGNGDISPSRVEVFIEEVRRAAYSFGNTWTFSGSIRKAEKLSPNIYPVNRVDGEYIPHQESHKGSIVVIEFLND